jgi:primosomal protein N' (replication factor Y) (superfamily II helicase)
MKGSHGVKEKDVSTDLTRIEVAVALPVEGTYTYNVPQALAPFAKIGKRVVVPFGNRKVTGYILGPAAPTDNAEKREIKPIADLLDHQALFPPVMIPFFKWIASYYMHPLGEVIKGALPSGLNLYESVAIELTEKGRHHLASCDPKSSEAGILGHLTNGPCHLKHLPGQLKKSLTAAAIHKLERCKWIKKQRHLVGGAIGARTEPYVVLGPGIPPDGKLSSQRRKILEAVSADGEVSLKSLKEKVQTTSSLIRKMADAGYLQIVNRRVYRDPFGEKIPPDTPPVLTIEQQHAVEGVLSSLGKGYTTFLLAGVTGSGKTEVYMQLAASALERCFSTLILVPEIALISQMERRFRARFGDCVAVLHSGLSPGERYDQWVRIRGKETPIAIGTRSAIFAPFSNLGLIIVDEEHDTSYKQEHHLRYNARDLAVVRAKLGRGVALLGSATPSVQSYHNIKRQHFIELTLKHRVEKRALPEITVVDLCEHRHRRGLHRYITPKLKTAMKETLDRGQQTLVFLNRRGFASFPICSSCGEPIRCKNCDISLTLHQEIHAYKCHYCGFTKAAASDCPACGSSKIHLLGLGTEKVEEAIKTLFPQAAVTRMDRDTTRKKGALINILKGLRDQTIDILIGTQMIAKGHDFPNITLVGIICADLSLNFPDFRAGERTFQLLAQVSGRAGRGDAAGRVILQTYNPEHFSIDAAKEQNFKRFYEKEIEFRKELKYPPFSRMILLKISGKDKQNTEQFARALGDISRELKTGGQAGRHDIEVLGPIAAPVSRIADRFRWQIMLKAPNAGTLHQFTRQLVMKSHTVAGRRRVQLAVDVDPVFMM